MSFFSFLGKAAKTVGKATLGVVKTTAITAGNVAGGVVGLDGLGSTINMSLSKQPAAVNGAPVGQVDGSQQTVVVQQPTLGSSITGFFGAATDFLTGKSHAQVDVNTGVGGRATDVASSGLPSWALPAALAAGGLFLVTSMSGNKRR